MSDGEANLVPVDNALATEVASAFDGRPRIPGSVYKLMPHSVGAECVPADVVCCDNTCSARAIISTVTPDRAGELLVPTGIRLDNYRKNPVVLFEHGFTSIVLPVGTSENPTDQSLDVQVRENEIEACCYFHMKTLESSQIYELVRDRVIRATSVQAIPLARVAEKIEGYGKVSVVPEWDLVEWSWGMTGVNPEAIRKTLSAGRLSGKPIVDPLAHLLSRYAPEKRVVVSGVEIPGTVSKTPLAGGNAASDAAGDCKTPAANNARCKTMTYTAEQVAAMSDDDLRTAGEKSPELDAASQDLVKAEIAKREAAKAAAAAASNPEGGESENESEDEPNATPLGAQVLQSVHSSLKGVLENAATALKPVENAEVKTATEAVLEQIGTAVTDLEGLYATSYPDLPSLSSAGEADSEAEAAVVKSWLKAGGKTHEIRLAGVGSRLSALVGAANLTQAQRVAMTGIATAISKTLTAAKQSADTAQEQRLAKIEESNAKIMERLNKLAPRR